MGSLLEMSLGGRKGRYRVFDYARSKETVRSMFCLLNVFITCVRRHCDGAARGFLPNPKRMISTMQINIDILSYPYYQICRKFIFNWQQAWNSQELERPLAIPLNAGFVTCCEHSDIAAAGDFQLKFELSTCRSITVIGQFHGNVNNRAN